MISLIEATMTEFAHDSNGNPTSHVIIEQIDPSGARRCIWSSKRRIQTGYAEHRSEGAQGKLYDLFTQPHVTRVSSEGSRSEGRVVTRFTVETFPTVNAGGRTYEYRYPPRGYVVAVDWPGQFKTTSQVQFLLRQVGCPDAVLYGDAIWVPGIG